MSEHSPDPPESSKPPELREEEIPFTDFVQRKENTLFPLESANGTRFDNLGKTDLKEIIRRVFIYANPSKPQTKECLKELKSILNDLDIEPLIYNESEPSRAHLIEYISQALKVPLETKSWEYYGKNPGMMFTDLNGQEFFDLVITVGGDGTVLKYLSYSPFRDIPILPINTGSLGYITSISFYNMRESMKTIFSGSFVYSSRIMLKARLLDRYQNPKHVRNYFALNEIAISGGHGILADMELQVGNSSIPVQGDGIVVATPTGSTAYSLAAGGPIVDTEMEALIVTPVSPFSLATRPVVISSDKYLFVRNASAPKSTIMQRQAKESERLIELHELGRSEAQLSVTIDGWGLSQLAPGESIHITGSDERIHFLAMTHNNSYFENIRTKLGWHNVAHHRS